jgi:hypothetical protein
MDTDWVFQETLLQIKVKINTKANTGIRRSSFRKREEILPNISKNFNWHNNKFF